MRWRPRPPVEQVPSGLFERAVERFTDSEAGRTVAGLTRTLGVPRVSVGALAGAPRVVRITVAWDLTWYQWGIDLGDGGGEVSELATGRELTEVDAAARQWNATALEDGRIEVTAKPRPPAFVRAVR